MKTLENTEPGAKRILRERGFIFYALPILKAACPASLHTDFGMNFFKGGHIT